MKTISLIGVVFLLSACSHKPSSSAKQEQELQPVQSACATYQGRPSPKNFSDYDADNSGSISRAEYLCQVVKHFTALNSDGDDYLEGQEISIPLKKSDENGDKKISIIEFMHTAEMAFDLADKNKSGDLSKSEFKDANRLLP
jgi:Ca2+-binding EF-hand superfamily protein